MKNRWAIQVLDSMKPQEIKAFRHWWKPHIQPPIPIVWQLFEYVRHPQNRQRPDEHLWQALHPERPLNDTLLRGYFSQLFKTLCDFLVQQALAEEENLRQLLLLKAFNQHHLPALFAQQERKIKRKLDSQPLLDEEDLYLRYQVEVETHNHHIRLAPHAPTHENLAGISQAFRQWSQLQALIIAVHNLSCELISGKKVPPPFPPSLLGVHLPPDPQENPLTHLYRGLYRALTPPMQLEEAYPLIEAVKGFPADGKSAAMRHLIGLLINTLVPQVNRSGSNTVPALILKQLYEWGFEAGWVYRDNWLIPQHFINYLHVCLRIGDIQRADAFRQTYLPRLLPEMRGELGQYFEAAICFEQQRYLEVRQMLGILHFSHLFLEINRRFLLLKAHYETHIGQENWGEEAEYLISQAHTLRKFTREQRLSPLHKNGYLNRFRLFIKLVKAYSYQDLLKLREEISRTQPLDRATWLEAKVTERLQAIGPLPA